MHCIFSSYSHSVYHLYKITLHFNYVRNKIPINSLASLIIKIICILFVLTVLNIRSVWWISTHVLRFLSKCTNEHKYNHNIIISRTNATYRPSTTVTVTLLIEHLLWLLWEDSVYKAISLSINAGCFGRGRSTVSLLSMEITKDIVGLSLAKSCTHNNPTCMHLKISILKQGSDIIGSIKATMLSTFHNFHA